MTRTIGNSGIANDRTRASNSRPTSFAPSSPVTQGCHRLLPCDTSPCTRDRELVDRRGDTRNLLGQGQNCCFLSHAFLSSNVQVFVRSALNLDAFHFVSQHPDVERCLCYCPHLPGAGCVHYFIPDLLTTSGTIVLQGRRGTRSKNRIFSLRDSIHWDRIASLSHPYTRCLSTRRGRSWWICARGCIILSWK